jgi:hypothetical protein
MGLKVRNPQVSVFLRLFLLILHLGKSVISKKSLLLLYLYLTKQKKWKFFLCTRVKVIFDFRGWSYNTILQLFTMLKWLTSCKTYLNVILPWNLQV